MYIYKIGVKALKSKKNYNFLVPLKNGIIVNTITLHKLMKMGYKLINIVD